MLAGLLILIVLTAVMQILLRNFFSGGVVWADAFIRMLVLWVGLVGAMTASRRGEHITIDLVQRWLPPQARVFVAAAVESLTAGVCCVAAFYSFQFVRREMADGLVVFFGIPVWACEAIIPFAFAVIAVRYGALALGHMTGRQGEQP